MTFLGIKTLQGLNCLCIPTFSFHIEKRVHATFEKVHYTPGIYAEGYIVFVFPFVRLFVRSYLRHVCRICVKVLRQCFSSGVYLSNYLPKSIHIWTIVTLEG